MQLGNFKNLLLFSASLTLLTGALSAFYPSALADEAENSKDTSTTGQEKKSTASEKSDSAEDEEGESKPIPATTSAVPPPPPAEPVNDAPTSPQADEAILKAKAELAKNKFVEARQILKQSIRSNPKNVQLLMEYYPVCVKTNDWSDALQTCEKIFALDASKEKDLYVGYAEAFLKLRRTEKAQAAFQKALTFGKDKELIHHRLIEIAKLQKDEPGAEKEYTEYLKLRPTDGDMQFEYANILYKNKKTKEALTHYKLASENKPYDSSFHERYAYLLLFEKDYAGSIAEYRKAIQADPKQSARLTTALKFARAQQKAAEQAAAPKPAVPPAQK